MPISFGKSKEEDVVSLIAAKKYARAVEVLKAQLQKRGANPSLRMQLADVLIMADKKQEAVALLLPLADQYARDGFAAKAVSVLKKVQKMDPGRRDVEERLARQIEERQREAAVSLPRSVGMIGMEEAGAPAPGPDADPSLEIGFESMAPVSAPVGTPPPVERAPLPPRLAPALGPRPSPAGRPAPRPTPLPVDSPLLAPPAPSRHRPRLSWSRLPTRGSRTTTSCTPARRRTRVDVPLDAVEVIEEAPAAEPMSAGQFADELMGLVDSVFQEFPEPRPRRPPPRRRPRRAAGARSS